MKIMLVDDKDISNFIMRKFIEIRKPDATVKEFTDPKEAYEGIKDFNPDIIFLDLNMPIMNGWQFLDKMLTDKLSQKVAILTSSTSNEDMEKSKSYGNVVNFYVKPLTPDELARVFTDLNTQTPA
ncbi:response regulator [Owenweeksia hongkongensis]|uniref:response regulator n=1 Tax=Owenweeksia hongkongensis TaxID=253245 RepID=UPI003A90913B